MRVCEHFDKVACRDNNKILCTLFFVFFFCVVMWMDRQTQTVMLNSKSHTKFKALILQQLQPPPLPPQQTCERKQGRKSMKKGTPRQ